MKVGHFTGFYATYERIDLNVFFIGSDLYGIHRDFKQSINVTL